MACFLHVAPDMAQFLRVEIRRGFFCYFSLFIRFGVDFSAETMYNE